MDIIHLSETYLDSSIQSDNDNLENPGYNLVRFDHSSNYKRGGVSKYRKASLPLTVINICFLHRCINFELMKGDKQCNFVALYRSPSPKKYKNTRNHNGGNSFGIGAWNLQVAVLLKSNLNF